MKVKVIRAFSDKFNLTHIFNPGEVLDFEESRAADIVVRGLGEYFQEEETAAPAEPEKEPLNEAPESVPQEEPALTEENLTEQEEVNPSESGEPSEQEGVKSKKGRRKKSEQ